MSVTLQYEDEDGMFQTVTQPDVSTAIQAAIILAKDHNAKPLRILSEKAGVLVARKCLEQQVGFALDSERTQREAIKRIAQEKRDREASQTLAEQRERAREIFEQARRARRMQALEELPGWGSF
jgi:hypothetical protein